MGKFRRSLHETAFNAVKSYLDRDITSLYGSNRKVLDYHGAANSSMLHPTTPLLHSSKSVARLFVKFGQGEMSTWILFFSLK